MKSTELSDTPRAARIARLLEATPRNAQASQLVHVIAELMVNIHRSTRSEQDAIREALAPLRDFSGAVEALCQSYEKSSPTDFNRKFLTLQILGHLQRQDALPFLAELVRRDLPPARRGVCAHRGARDVEERLRVKAVHGIAYLRSSEAREVLLTVMQSHPSLAVRVAAIDSYSWNAGDSADVVRELKQVLSPAFHPYLLRPRFYRGMNALDFDLRMFRWMKEWAAKGSLPRQPVLAASKR